VPVGREAITGIDSNARPDGGRKAVPVGREATTGIDSNARPNGGRKAVPSTPDRAWHPGPSV